jgi:hypothetical protein
MTDPKSAGDLSAARRTRSVATWLVVLLISVSTACAGSQKKSGEREKLVSDETQQESGELSGRQQMMGDYNASPADQAAARHEMRTRPAKNPERENKSKEK